MKDDEIANLFAGNAALVSAIVQVLIKKKLIHIEDLINELDLNISKSKDASGKATASLRHMRSILMSNWMNEGGKAGS